MANPSKQKGTSFESLIRDYLKVQWSDDIERLTLSGSSDRGDIANFRLGGSGGPLLALELKNCRQTALPKWIREAKAEAQNYGAMAGVVIHKQHGVAAAGEQLVTLTLSDFLDILRAIHP